jgi:hypothetical protein
MSSARRNTLSYRAAKYFGVQNEPRTSIPMGDGKCIVVMHRGGRLCLAVYEENGWHGSGIYLNFTDAKYEALHDAIDEHWKAA